MHPDHALPHEIEPAFRLLLSNLGKSEREYRVARAVELVLSGQMDVRGLFVLREAGEIAGVIACEPLPGAGSIIWPPVLAGTQNIDLEDLLVGRACDWLLQHRARLAQCLLPPEDALLAEPLLRNGFTRITSLSYLRNSLRREDVPPLVTRLHFEPYDPDNPRLFHETLVRTYQSTLDCPEVNGVRTIEEVIEGHRAQGPFDPGLWLLAFEDNQPIGVLMLGVARPGEEWEVGYMGIVPEAAPARLRPRDPGQSPGRCPCWRGVEHHLVRGRPQRPGLAALPADGVHFVRSAACFPDCLAARFVIAGAVAARWICLSQVIGGRHGTEFVARLQSPSDAPGVGFPSRVLACSPA